MKLIGTIPVLDLTSKDVLDMIKSMRENNLAYSCVKKSHMMLRMAIAFLSDDMVEGLGVEVC